ncbi:MAG: hypothetical protein COW42_10290, partial [Deltaproteobacteria bacterium CG17_big_fil_post_rev_8_21_14_2_50_63_7]
MMAPIRSPRRPEEQEMWPPWQMAQTDSTLHGRRRRLSIARGCGRMGEDLRKKLMGEVLTVEWEGLRVHAERDRLFFVSTVLDLVEVGCALATNDRGRIAKWVDEARLRRPT